MDIFVCACRNVESGQEVAWRTETHKMAFTTATQAILGDEISDKDMNYLLPFTHQRDAALLSLVRTNTAAVLVFLTDSMVISHACHTSRRVISHACWFGFFG